MAVKNINEDMTTSLLIGTSNDTYILGKNTTIETMNQPAIDMVFGANNNILILKGDVAAEGTDSVIGAAGGNIHIDVRLGVQVDGQLATAGIFASGPDFSLDNAGDISGALVGVSVEDYAEVVNSGLMLGSAGGLYAGEGLHLTNSGIVTADTFGLLAVADGSVIRNLESGRITGETNGIGLTGDGTALIINAGLIKGQTAISNGGGNATIINKGKIDGNVNLGAGNDIFDTRTGTFDGVVDGGEGNDTYIIGKQAIQIVEAADSGFDAVHSSLSFTLGETFEDLVLLGSTNTKGTGNGAGNYLTGSKGDNVLSGLDGEDYLTGGKGNDVLTGGSGMDLFDFRKGTGHDVVTDFADGEDIIYTPFAANKADLLANHLIEKSGGVLVSYGNDSLFIKGVTLDDLDQNDFL
ncbi:calcium-binding protein [Rhizobium sp. LjRoot254]|uniref:calcium-binding protein n=1 Tax=Rhizobium sp. LjRoot254 TaxID=3342297 RepID=UPI003ECD64ED